MPPSAVKKGRKTARISAGSKPPRIRLAPVDNMSVESSDEAVAEMGEDDDADSFIDDRELDDGVVSPVSVKQEKALPAKERGHTPPLNTRSRSKSTRIANSDDTLSADGAPAASHLEPKKHSHSQSSKARGLASSSLEKPPGKSLEQTTLTVKTSPVSNLTPDEYQSEMLLAYRDSVQPTNQAASHSNQSSVDPDIEEVGSPVRDTVSRKKDAPTSSVGTTSSTLRGVKRSHAHSEDDSSTLPANVEAAFNATIKTSSSPKKKKPNLPAIDSSVQVLHTENIKTISKLPSRCGVTDPSIQDPLLKTVYRSLPNISKGMFVTWSTSTGPGNFLISHWKQHCPGINIRSLWSTINFVQKDHYINLSRVSPVGLQAISQVYGNRNRWSLCIDGKTAVCISVMMAVKSALQAPATVVAPSQKSRWSKFVTAIPHSQEFERLVGVVCMAFHHTPLHAQIHCDAIAFSTKTFAKDQGPAVRAQFTQGVPSSSTKIAQPTTKSSDDALHWEDDIPIYDGRHSELNFTRTIDDLDRLLPRFEDNDCEIPNGSCIAVAYTVTQYELSGKESVSFNIKFVVVIATPDDDNGVDDTMDDTDPLLSAEVGSDVE